MGAGVGATATPSVVATQGGGEALVGGGGDGGEGLGSTGEGVGGGPDPGGLLGVGLDRVGQVVVGVLPVPRRRWPARSASGP